MTSLLFYFFLLAALILLGAFYSGAETALFSLSRSQLERFKKSKQPMEKLLIQFLSSPRDTLVTILFGNEITNIAFSVILASFVLNLLGPDRMEAATAVSITVGTLVILIFSEIIPKNIAILYASSLAPFVALLLKPLHIALRPVRFLLVHFTDWFIAKLGGEPRKESPLIVEEEFRYLLELGATTGQVAQEEKEMIHKALEFGEKVVAQIMTPKSLVFALPVDLAYEELLQQIKATQFSRIPVYEENPDNIVGLLYVKDLFTFNQKHQKDPSRAIREILRPPLFVSHQKKLEEVLQQFRETRIHMAVAVDEKNRPTGIVTMHDVLEELFGEMEE